MPVIQQSSYQQPNIGTPVLNSHNNFSQYLPGQGHYRFPSYSNSTSAFQPYISQYQQNSFTPDGHQQFFMPHQQLYSQQQFRHQPQHNQESSPVDPAVSSPIANAMVSSLFMSDTTDSTPDGDAILRAIGSNKDQTTPMLNTPTNNISDDDVDAVTIEKEHCKQCELYKIQIESLEQQLNEGKHF